MSRKKGVILCVIIVSGVFFSLSLSEKGMAVSDYFIEIEEGDIFGFEIVYLNSTLAEEFQVDMDPLGGENASVGSSKYYRIKSLEYSTSLSHPTSEGFTEGWEGVIAYGEWNNKSRENYNFSMEDDAFYFKDPSVYPDDFSMISWFEFTGILFPINDYLENITFSEQISLTDKTIIKEESSKYQVYVFNEYDGYLDKRICKTEDQRKIYEIERIYPEDPEPPPDSEPEPEEGTPLFHDHPNDRDYYNNTHNFTMYWTISDEDGDLENYTLYRNGTLLLEGDFTNQSEETIRYTEQVADLSIGVHNYTFSVIDNKSNVVSDSTIITIKGFIDDSEDPNDNDTEEGGESFLIWLVSLISLFSLIGFGILGILIVKTRRKGKEEIKELKEKKGSPLDMYSSFDDFIKFTNMLIEEGLISKKRGEYGRAIHFWEKSIRQYQMLQEDRRRLKDLKGSGKKTETQRELEENINLLRVEIEKAQRRKKKEYITYFEDIQSIHKILVIHRRAGACLSTLGSRSGQKLDEDLVSSFLTAILSFKTELKNKIGRASMNGNERNILEFHDFVITLTDGYFIRLAIVSERRLGEITKERCDTIIREFEEQFNAPLRSFEGDLQPFTEFGDIIEQSLDLVLNGRMRLGGNVLKKVEDEVIREAIRHINGAVIPSRFVSYLTEVKGVSKENAIYKTYMLYKREILCPIK